MLLVLISLEYIQFKISDCDEYSQKSTLKC